MSTSIVFFDLETGGLEPVAAVIQLAALAVSVPDFEEMEVFERKIQFNESLASPEALRINSYDRETWAAEAVPESEAVADFGAFLERHRSVECFSKAGRPYRVARVAGHNIVAFDLDRLLAMFKRARAFCPVDLRSPLDTRLGAVWHFARHPEGAPVSFSLTALAEHFRIETSGAHDAAVDCRLSAAVARELLR